MATESTETTEKCGVDFSPLIVNKVFQAIDSLKPSVGSVDSVAIK